jgi:hypothetical protein
MGKRSMSLEIEILCSNVQEYHYLIAKKIYSQTGNFNLTRVIPEVGYEFNLICCPHCNEIIPLKIYNIKQIEKEAEEARPLHEKHLQERKDLGLKIIKIGGYFLLIANIINIIASFFYESYYTQIEDIINGFIVTLLFSFAIFIIGTTIYYSYPNFKGQYSIVANNYIEKGTYTLVESWPSSVLSKITNEFVELGEEKSHVITEYTAKDSGLRNNLEQALFGSNIVLNSEQKQILNSYLSEFLKNGKKILGTQKDIDHAMEERRKKQEEPEESEDDWHVI